MQQTLYKDIPEVVLYYDKALEAYDSPNWTGLEDNISRAGRVLCGGSTRPTRPDAATQGNRGGRPRSSGSSSTLLIVGILGAIIVVVGIVMIARRGKNDEDLA